MKVIPEIRRAH